LSKSRRYNAKGIGSSFPEARIISGRKAVGSFTNHAENVG